MGMPRWKLGIFVRTITRRAKEENMGVEEVIARYPLLSEEEVQSIISEIETFGGETIGNL